MLPRRTLLPSFCAAILLLGFASAHPGRTDANGGHYNRSTGEYHYHHGYPAHQHTDGICPYHFDDRTGWNSGTSSGSAPSKSVQRTPKSPSTATVSPKPESEDLPLWMLSLSAIFTLSMTAFLINAAANKLSHRKILRQKQMAERQRCQTLYGGQTAESLCAMPDDTEIGADGLPKERGADGWGLKYTVYRSKTGKVYHRAGCNRSATIKLHAFNIESRTPCKKCRPSIPDRQWFETYLKIKSLKDMYHIK